MTEHKDIQNPKDYTAQDYMEFERKLFSHATPKSELEEICMTLAHIPAKQAQDILTRFRESGRASEVEWLDIAAEEGQYHYLSPTNEQEEKEYMALKVMQNLRDEIIDLEIKYDEIKLERDMLDIRYEAVKALVRKGEDFEIEESALHDVRVLKTSDMEELENDIALNEKIFEQIKASIKTERYKNADPECMRNVHFT